MILIVGKFAQKNAPAPIFLVSFPTISSLQFQRLDKHDGSSEHSFSMSTRKTRCWVGILPLQITVASEGLHCLDFPNLNMVNLVILAFLESHPRMEFGASQGRKKIYGPGWVNELCCLPR